MDADALTEEQVKGLRKVFVTKGERVFTTGTQSPAELAHLAYLLAHGYTLSRQA